MMTLSEQDIVEIASYLTAGQIGIVRTDTLYGFVCQASNRAAVERVYHLKGRDINKSPIVLVSDARQLFDYPNEQTTQFLGTVWPGKVSVIIPSTNAPDWVRRGNNSVAYRQPHTSWVQDLLCQTGPLIAPSANPQGQLPARTIEQAIEYFGETVDFYVDGGTVTDNTPSQLIRVSPDGSVERLR